MRRMTAGGGAWGTAGGMLPEGIKWLLIANVAVYSITLVVGPWGWGQWIGHVFGLQPATVIERGWVWQPLTYMFLHAGFFHLLFNMFVLWMFGAEIEALWGRNEFLKYYVVCGLGAAALSFPLAWNHLTVGASGAVLGVLLAFGILFPDRYVYIWFLIPIRAKWLVAGIAGLQLLYLVTGTSAGIAYAAHVGGMLAGWAYLVWLRGGSPLGQMSARWRRRRLHLVQGGKRRTREWTEAEIDRILDKISLHGLESLTAEEAEILDEASRRNRPD
ncbi:MAG TPA: rhomboid family intramembrane serine protease [Gemmatimonadota bacterium]|nr:rhomboid family intramembrane serine protease [Gemmatimonadota bacterium]